jgi:hypothetical protein
MKLRLQYIKEAYGLDIAKNGGLSALPPIARCVTQIGIGFASKWIRFKSPTISVKVYMLIATVFPAIFVILCTFLHCGQYGIAILFFVLAQGTVGFWVSATQKSQILISGPLIGFVGTYLFKSILTTCTYL